MIYYVFKNSIAFCHRYLLDVMWSRILKIELKLKKQKTKNKQTKKPAIKFQKFFSKTDISVHAKLT